MAPLTREAALRTLELDSDADEEAIRKAYKTLALQHHPDVRQPPCLLGCCQSQFFLLLTRVLLLFALSQKNQGSEASTAKFKEVSAAYERLQLSAEDEEAFDGEYDYDRDSSAAEELFERMFRAAWERRQESGRSGGGGGFGIFFGGGGGPFGGGRYSGGGYSSSPFGDFEFEDEDVGRFSFKRPTWSDDHAERLGELEDDMQELVGDFRGWKPSDDPAAFVAFFAPGFENLAQYSKRRNPPQLGDASTPLATVHQFYRFWRSLKHSRTFREEVPGGQLGEWGSSKVRERAVISFCRLISQFTSVAEEHDPRLVAAAAAVAAAKQEKAARAERERLAAEAAVAEAAREAAAREAEEKQRQCEARKDKEAQRKLMQKARKRLRTAASGLAYQQQSAAEELACGLDLEELTQLASLLERAGIEEKAKLVENARQRMGR